MARFFFQYITKHVSVFIQPHPLFLFPDHFTSYHFMSSHSYPLLSSFSHSCSFLQACTWIDVLTAEEVGRTLRRSDLDKLLEILEVIPMGIVASQQQVSRIHKLFGRRKQNLF